MSSELRVGVQLPEVERVVRWSELGAMALLAEEVGFDSIWVGDHLLYDLPDVGPRGPWEAWTVLAGLAALTQRVELGPLVAATGFHQPQMLAKMAATVDEISGGRLVLGMGAGWNEREFAAFGFPFDHRVARFGEAFTIVRSLLREGSVDFAGAHYRAERCVLSPRGPRPQGPPLMVGSIGERMLRLTLPYVDAWNGWWSWFRNRPEDLAALVRRVDGLCHQVGRDPADVARTAAVLVQMEGGVGRVMGDEAGHGVEPISGSADEIARSLLRFGEAGVSHLVLVVDPITPASIEALGPVLDRIHDQGWIDRRGGPWPV